MTNENLLIIQNKLGKYFKPFILILMSLMLFALGFQNVKPKQIKMRVNDVADVTIRAPYTTIDEKKTQENKQRARDSVADIYVFDETIRETQLSIVEEYFSSIRQLAKNKYSTQQLLQLLNTSDHLNTILSETTLNENKERTLTQLVPFAQLSANEKLLVYMSQLEDASAELRTFSINLDNDQHLQVLNMSDFNLIDVQTKVTKYLSEYLANEITADRVMKVNQSIETLINKDTFESQKRRLLKALINQLLVPTMVYSESQTASAKENAEANAPSVYILQGQVIIQEGYVVDSEMLRITNLYGFLDRKDSNYDVWAFISLIVIHALVVYYYFKKWGANHNGTFRELNTRITVYSLAFVSCFAGVVLTNVFQNQGLENGLLLFPAGMLPFLIIPKTDRRTALMAILFFNLMTLFIIKSQLDINNILWIILFYIFTMLVSMMIIDKEEIPIKQFIYRSILWYLVVIISLLFTVNIELFSTEMFNIIGFSFLSILLMYVLMFIISPYWNQLFDDRADLTMNELANLNHPLLKLLIEHAPGTYHHSILVANLSANAVEAIGGNSLYTRVASYYHDVGKIKHPLFFAENLPNGMVSPHQMVSPRESAEVIKGHVHEGVKLLREYRMPESIIQVCQEHHGTTPVYYFYFKEKEVNPEANIADFQYEGPIPQTKENAIIMIADSIEAASRTLKEHSIEKIENLVTSIVNKKIEYGQFKDCGLTVDELERVKKSMIKGIAGMFHTRVEYPE